MKKRQGEKLIIRYKKNYNIPSYVNITEEMILRHWELEKSLASEMLITKPERRWEIFEKNYSKLFNELDWLNKYVNTDHQKTIFNFETWVHLIGPIPKRIYEIGSGKGEMISYLANLGYECRATEITHERGKKYIQDSQNLVWDISDGVNLEKFTMNNFYDVVLSNQVLEHLHPDDISQHFKSACAILKNGGCYIFDTPHKYLGPSDVSRVFKCDKPLGMHLKEYTYREISDLLFCAGFYDVYAIIKLPRKVRMIMRLKATPKPSSIYLKYLCIIEKIISFVPTHLLRRKISMLMQLLLFPRGIFILARKK